MVWWKNPKRSKFGKWLDRQGITQVDFANHCKISMATMWRLCTNKEYVPGSVVLKKVMKAVKTIDGSKRPDDFFDI